MAKRGWIRTKLLQLHSAVLFWKWDLEYNAAVRRMRGCTHEHTVFVDVGSVCEKCWDCWALRMRAVDGSGKLQWTPNSANPRDAQRVKNHLGDDDHE